MEQRTRGPPSSAIISPVAIRLIAMTYGEEMGSQFIILTPDNSYSLSLLYLLRNPSLCARPIRKTLSLNLTKPPGTVDVGITEFASLRPGETETI